MPPLDPDRQIELVRSYRWVLGLFIAGLVLSGLTAFPLLQELEWMVSAFGLEGPRGLHEAGGFGRWILTVRNGLRESYALHPWLAYGTDWLAFAHLVLAVFFIGPWREPVRNVWVIQAGLVACALVIPLALVCGEVRGIPWGWRLIDCSFGVFGAIPLGFCLRWTNRMAASRS